MSPINKGFIEVGNWTLPGWVNLQSAADGVVLVNTTNYWYYDAPMIKSSIAPQAESGCDVYQLIPKQEPVLIKNLATCFYNNDGLALTASQIWQADGYAGIKHSKF